MAQDTGYSTLIERYFIDTRPLIPSNNGTAKSFKPPLPLLATLPHDIQDAVNKFMRAEDRFMSLASALLKFVFIHRTAKIPWSQVRISRTPRPHGRPYWDPPSEWHGQGFDGIEFNVSHQAGMVILAGCRTPDRPSISLGVGQASTAIMPDPAQQKNQQIRIGVDVACSKEPRRSPTVNSQAELNEWVDTFAEMFSERERKDMKERPVPGESVLMSEVMGQKLRRFYTYWALKEAYIKMVGEGLLADWLRKLEFVTVMSPDPGERLVLDEISMKVLFDGKDISDTVSVELEGMEDNFLFTMITRGIAEQRRDLAQWTRLDIEKDIRPCAEETCSCLG